MSYNYLKFRLKRLVQTIYFNDLNFKYFQLISIISILFALNLILNIPQFKMNVVIRKTKKIENTIIVKIVKIYFFFKNHVS